MWQELEHWKLCLPFSIVRLQFRFYYWDALNQMVHYIHLPVKKYPLIIWVILCSNQTRENLNSVIFSLSYVLDKSFNLFRVTKYFNSCLTFGDSRHQSQRKGKCASNSVYVSNSGLAYLPGNRVGVRTGIKNIELSKIMKTENKNKLKFCFSDNIFYW